MKVRLLELGVVAALPFVDYYLTMAGAALAAKAHGRHFKAESYELNPVWREDVARKRMFNPRHIVLAALLVAILAYADRASGADWYFPALFGLVIGAFAPIVGQHLGNIAVFSFLRANPNEVSGAIAYSMRYSIFSSLAQSIALILPLAAAASYARHPFVWGMLGGVGVITAARASWFLRAKRTSAPD